jgi:hypothetical protein
MIKEWWLDEWSTFEKLVHIWYVRVKHQIPKVTTSRIISNIMTVVMVVIWRPRDKRNHSHRHPFKLIPCMTLSAYKHFPTNPIEKSENMRTISQNYEAHCRRQLYYDKFTKFAIMKSTGWKYSVTHVYSVSNSWWTLCIL